MRPQYLLLILLLTCFYTTSVVVAARSSTGALSGTWKPIKNMKDPHVKEIAEFALSEHNKKSGDNLKLVEIIKADTQVVAGVNYRLVMKADDGSKTAKAKEYVAVLTEEPAAHKHLIRNLTSFNALLT